MSGSGICSVTIAWAGLSGASSKTKTPNSCSAQLAFGKRTCLSSKNRLPINEPPGVWIGNALRILQVREAGITFAIALRARSLALEHQDPADRFIAATAIELKASLLTSDERLLACPDVRCF